MKKLHLALALLIVLLAGNSYAQTAFQEKMFATGVEKAQKYKYQNLGNNNTPVQLPKHPDAVEIEKQAQQAKNAAATPATSPATPATPAVPAVATTPAPAAPATPATAKQPRRSALTGFGKSQERKVDKKNGVVMKSNMDQVRKSFIDGDSKKPKPVVSVY